MSDTFTIILCNKTFNVTDASNEQDIPDGVGYTLVFLLGFLVNAAALRAFISKWKSWTDTHIYMLNLALADTALILFLPFRIYDAFFRLPKTYMCTVLISTHYINMYASILTTTAISVQRYLVIRFPLQARSWRKKKEIAFAVCLILWGLLLTICIRFQEDNHPKNLWTCYERCKDHPLKEGFLVILVVLGFLIPLLIIVFCSNRIICILSKDDDKSEEKKSIIGIVTANMIVFIFCYTPIHVCFVVNYFYIPPKNWQLLPRSSPHVLLLVSEWIASTNCCLDSISYYFLLRRMYA